LLDYPVKTRVSLIYIIYLKGVQKAVKILKSQVIQDIDKWSNGYCAVTRLFYAWSG